MGRRSLTKGKRGEREAAAEIRRLFGTDANRGRQYSGGPDSPDIVTGIEDVHFEVKRAEALQLYAAIEQATRDAAEKSRWCFTAKTTNLGWRLSRWTNLPRLAFQLFLAMTEGE